jgi:hypothetical protein
MKYEHMNIERGYCVLEVEKAVQVQVHELHYCTAYYWIPVELAYR